MTTQAYVRLDLTTTMTIVQALHVARNGDSCPNPAALTNAIDYLTDAANDAVLVGPPTSQPANDGRVVRLGEDSYHADEAGTLRLVEGTNPSGDSPNILFGTTRTHLTRNVDIDPTPSFAGWAAPGPAVPNAPAAAALQAAPDQSPSDDSSSAATDDDTPDDDGGW